MISLSSFAMFLLLNHVHSFVYSHVLSFFGILSILSAFPLLYLFCNPHSSSFLPDLICLFSQLLHSQYCFISFSLLLLGSLKLNKLGNQTRHTFHRSTKYLNSISHIYLFFSRFFIRLFIYVKTLELCLYCTESAGECTSKHLESKIFLGP